VSIQPGDPRCDGTVGEPLRLQYGIQLFLDARDLRKADVVYLLRIERCGGVATDQVIVVAIAVRQLPYAIVLGYLRLQPFEVNDQTAIRRVHTAVDDCLRIPQELTPPTYLH